MHTGTSHYRFSIPSRSQNNTLEMTNSISATILGRTLGIFFLIVGTRKLYGWERARNEYLETHPIWVYYTTAIVEVVSGTGLLFSSTRFTAVTLLLLLIVGVLLHPWKLKPVDGKFVVRVCVAAGLLVGSVLLG